MDRVGWASGMTVAGLVSRNFEIVKVGYVAGDSLVCGLVGRNDMRATSGYATGDVTASGEGGRFGGDNRRRFERPSL